MFLSRSVNVFGSEDFEEILKGELSESPAFLPVGRGKPVQVDTVYDVYDSDDTITAIVGVSVLDGAGGFHETTRSVRCEVEITKHNGWASASAIEDDDDPDGW